MRHATTLRCFRHFQQNCCDRLHKIGIQKSTEQKFFIDTVFGMPISEGLLDAYDKSDLRACTLAAKEVTDKEVKLTGNKTLEFYNYVNSHKKMMKKCMIATARSKVGMPKDESGKPLKSYTDQSESINNKLTCQKEAIAKNDKNKVDMSKVQFMKNVWEEVNRHQQKELKLAICGVSNEYELAEVVAYLEVPIDKWFDMNEDERSAYVQEFYKMTIEDVMKGKTIAASHVPTAQVSEFKEFSVDLRKMLQSFENWTDGMVGTIVKDAETLLNLKDAVQRMASISSH